MHSGSGAQGTPLADNTLLPQACASSSPVACLMPDGASAPGLDCCDWLIGEVTGPWLGECVMSRHLSWSSGLGSKLPGIFSLLPSS